MIPAKVLGLSFPGLPVRWDRGSSEGILASNVKGSVFLVLPRVAFGISSKRGFRFALFLMYIEIEKPANLGSDSVRVERHDRIMFFVCTHDSGCMIPHQM